MTKQAIVAVLAAMLSSGLLPTVCEAQKANEPTAQQRLHAPLWGDLTPGPYQVGYRVLYHFDPTCTWTITRPYGKSFTPDLRGRPVRVSVWYPARIRSPKVPMRIVDYVQAVAPPGFREMNAVLEQRDREDLARMARPEQLGSLLATRMVATLDPPTAAGAFPLVLYAGGINANNISGLVPAEFLASHGYVVVAVPSLGPSNHEPDQVYSPAEMETTVRDLEFAWSIMRDQPSVDGRKLAVVGYSLGGTVAMMFAIRNANVEAVAGLDGTYGKDTPGPPPGSKTLTEFYGYVPQKMRASILDLQRSDYGAKLDPSGVHAFHHSDRYFITLPRIIHPDFTTYAAIKRAFHTPLPKWVSESGYTTETGFQSFQRVCRLVRDFFDAKLKGDANGIARLSAGVGEVDGAVMTHEKALPTPPSPQEFVALIADRGFDAAIQIVEQYGRDQPEKIVVDERVFNRLGYNLIAEKRFAEAIGVLRLVTHVYPKSWNAADSLGEAYVAGGQKKEARAAYQRALDLAAADPGLDPEKRKTIVKAEQTKLEQLKP